MCFGVNNMEQKLCKNCEHYRQHYILRSRKIYRVYCGHCVMYPTKRRKPDTKGCESFVFTQPDEFAFASKEYLSKELLQYVLKLEILPKIEDEKV